MHIVVDGYNLIRQSDILRTHERQGLENGRKALIHLLAGYRRSKGHRITVVFDGWLGGPSEEERDREAGIEIIYSRRGEKADEVIKRIARAQGGDLMVVTSDRPVMDAASRAGVTAVSSRDFESRIRAGAVPRPYTQAREEDSEDREHSRGKKKGPSHRVSKREKLKQRGLDRL